MKRFLIPSIIFLILILAACASPQATPFAEVTVTSTPTSTPTLPPPTATIIPTPTLHPEFVSIQDTIAAAGERFTLMPDGTVSDNGVAIPGLQVDKNGVMTITVNGEPVILKPADVTFDDEQGFLPNGYTQNENGEFVPELLPEQQAAIDAEKQMNTDVDKWNQELSEWGLSDDDYTKGQDVDGNIVMINNETAKVVWWNGYWDINVMRTMIVETHVKEKMCQGTNYVGEVGKNVQPRKNGDLFFKNYWSPFVSKIKSMMSSEGYPYGTFIAYDYLGNDINCWAAEPFTSLRVTRDGMELTRIFWKSANNSGVVLSENVFNPTVKKILLSSK